ncbi:hypothetical protein VTO73DRAFT_10401 [Trametes versicolor]
MATPSLDVAQGQPTDRSSISVISAVVGACVALSCFLMLMAVACVLHRWKRTRCRALMRDRGCKEPDTRVGSPESFSKFDDTLSPASESGQSRFSYDGAVIHIRPETPCRRDTQQMSTLAYAGSRVEPAA